LALFLGTRSEIRLFFAGGISSGRSLFSNRSESAFASSSRTLGVVNSSATAHAASDIPDEGNLMDLYNIDSVNLFEIVVGLEEDFEISLEDADFSTETFSTVENIAGYVEQKRG
jgi:acyl carrier protein